MKWIKRGKRKEQIEVDYIKRERDALDKIESKKH